jgi:hypothetical protein
MRTTVTLDDDVVVLLKRTSRERGVPVKRILNEALRAGLAGPTARKKRYRLPVQPMGLRPGVDLDKASHLAGDIEDEEVVRKLELRK